MEEVREVVEQLFSKETKKGCQALRILEKKSEESDVVYAHFDRFVELMEDENSYRRTRGLLLIAANAKWDTEGKINKIIDRYVAHFGDEKPITARQCIKAAPSITKAKPELKDVIIGALHGVGIKQYKDSMQPLVYEDIVKALQEIDRQ